MQVQTITLTVTVDDAEGLAKKLKFLWPNQILAYIINGPYDIVDFTEKKS